MLEKDNKTIEIINRFRIVHGDKYDYSKVEYKNTNTKVCIICPIHGEFWQTPRAHLRGQGCRKCVIDAHKKLVFGVGVNDLYTKDNFERKIYQRWTRILHRCYDEIYLNEFPTYRKCYVCPEWLVFSNFKKWFEDNYIEGYELDKDIIKKGNKVYSPQTCCFVPQEINKLLIKADNRRGKYPIGVSKRRGVYVATVSIKSKITEIGRFDNVLSAFNAYKRAKESQIKSIALEYFAKGKITQRVFNALMKYEVEMTD